MTPPVPLVLRRVEVRDAIARFVDVAFPAVSAVVFNIEEVAFVVLRLVANRFVDVAFVDVLFVMVTPLKVDDAPLMMSPSEVVGVRAPDAIVQSRNELLMKSTPAIA